MAPPDRYGPLATPEGRTHIEVRENPVEVARAAYRIWRPIARKHPFSYGLPNLWEPPYREAVALLAPRAQTFAAVRKSELDAITDMVNDENLYSDGLFLCALHNATRIKTLDSVFSHHGVIGYRLPPGKSVIARKESWLAHLGYEAEGTIVNHGAAIHLAYAAQGGIQLNNGIITNGMATAACGGVQINHGSVNDMAVYASGGIQANHATAKSFAQQANGGIQTNYCTASVLGYQAEDGIQANFGRADWSGPLAKTGFQVNYGSARIMRRTPDAAACGRSEPLLRQLGEMTAELGRLTAKDVQLDLAAIGKLEREILACGRRIEKLF